MFYSTSSLLIFLIVSDNPVEDLRNCIAKQDLANLRRRADALLSRYDNSLMVTYSDELDDPELIRLILNGIKFHFSCTPLSSFSSTCNETTVAVSYQRCLKVLMQRRFFQHFSYSLQDHFFSKQYTNFHRRTRARIYHAYHQLKITR